MLRIGLTGGIGSGKSTVAGLFAAHGTPVIDADVIAHQLTQPGTSATRQVLQAFGAEIAKNNDEIDRKRLAERIFQSEQDRQRLEKILHPLIKLEMQTAYEKLRSEYCLLVIPLLFEADQKDLVDRVLVVDVDENTQIARARLRDGRSETEVRAILAVQLNRKQRVALADDCILNVGDLEALKHQVEVLHQRYLTLAKQFRNTPNYSR